MFQKYVESVTTEQLRNIFKNIFMESLTMWRCDKKMRKLVDKKYENISKVKYSHTFKFIKIKISNTLTFLRMSNFISNATNIKS